jgi:uncharacterized protein YukE
MTACLDVVPQLISRVAAVGRGRHEELAAVYARTQSRGWDAEAGWVGRSGRALSALLDRWQSAAAEQYGLLDYHHCGLDSAASAYDDMERAHARRLSRTHDADAG